MFDQVTEAMIGSARPLKNLDPSTLAQELTDAHVEVVSARLALGKIADEAMDDLPVKLRRLSRLADIYEAEIVLNLNAAHTKSMAYVAASARQVNSQAEQIINGKLRPVSLSEFSIGPDIAAALLYLIAERSSDAYEAAQSIFNDGSSAAPSSALARAIRNYAQGRLISILADNIDLRPWGDINCEIEPSELLFYEILKGLIILAKVGLGISNVADVELARSLFNRAHELSVESTEIDGLLDKNIVFNSIFAGPHRLSALLLCIADGFTSNAVVLLPAPVGSHAQTWRNWLTAESRKWPFIWESHREAIALGYLDSGMSLVMTTPTGSGKSTLAALKIAATLCAGKKVLYLAPTHALVSQVEHDLNERVGKIENAHSIEDISLDDNIENLPAISVATPERCFALLTFAPEIFEDVGLLVFDECHLLGASNKGDTLRADRRSIDAMLCLLTFISINSRADCLLLSAMISNGNVVAEWLENLLRRPVFAYDNKWKPTRQLRSCVVYEQQDIRAIEHGLKRKPVRGAPPPAAVPYGLFSLTAGWNPGSIDTLLIKSLSSSPVSFKVGSAGKSFRYLTANRNVVAATIAWQLASRGMKVIVFCDSVGTCSSIADKINKSAENLTPNFTAEQEEWRSEIFAEVGAPSGSYDSGSLFAAVHHGELLSSERKLVESLFKDKNSGVNVLAATSTLAQGLNLPCEAVIIAGTDRLDESDPEEKKRTPLLAHEILNAVGRAGRAGQAATGLSIVVPGTPISCDFGTMDVSDERDLSILFAADDQCFPLADPLSTLFDQIEVSGAKSQETQYLLRRLAVSLSASNKTSDSFETIARRTFGFYERSQIDQASGEKWLFDRKRTLEDLISSNVVSNVEWIEELAAKTGASSSFISALADNYPTAPKHSLEAEDWLLWLLNILNHEDNSFDIFLRPETMVRVFGRAVTCLNIPSERRAFARKSTMHVFSFWFGGKTLGEMENEIASWVAAFEGTVLRPTLPHKKLKRARRFVLRVIPDVAFICGILVQVGQHISAQQGEAIPRTLQFLPSLVRKGFRTAYHYALQNNAKVSFRTRASAEFSSVKNYIEMSPYDDWKAVLDKVQTAKGIAGFLDSMD